MQRLPRTRIERLKLCWVFPGRQRVVCDQSEERIFRNRFASIAHLCRLPILPRMEGSLLWSRNRKGLQGRRPVPISSSHERATAARGAHAARGLFSATRRNIVPQTSRSPSGVPEKGMTKGLASRQTQQAGVRCSPFNCIVPVHTALPAFVCGDPVAAVSRAKWKPNPLR